MAMLHKAFLLDYAGFEGELKPILENALASGDCAGLIQYIRDNLASLKDPDEAEPLDEDWETAIENPDAHEYGDIALTKFYDPAEDIGLDDEWEAIQESVGGVGLKQSPILGATIGNEPFDPGRMGAYFQSPEQVRASLMDLNALPDSEAVESAIAMLKHALNTGAGLYVVF